MAGTNETLYIKAEKNTEVTKSDVTLGDVLSMECSNPSVVSKVKALKLIKIPESKDRKQQRAVISVLKVIERIHREYPHIDVQNVGEADFIVTYEKQKTPNQFVHYLKVSGVVFTTFIGAAFSIMAFNNDVDTRRLFSQIYELVAGVPSDGFTILELTYCVGLIIGILIFFNHFGNKRFSVDPTPIEVEMRVYEGEIQDTLIEGYSRKGRELDAGKTNISGTHRS